MPNYLAIALQYHKAGLKVIPCNSDKTPKTDVCPKFSDYTHTQTEGDIKRLFTNDCAFIAIICSKDIEVIDFDLKNDRMKGTVLGVWEQYTDQIMQFPRAEELYFENTLNGGVHIIYKTNFKESNLKLAKLADQKEAVIETRGSENAYCVVAPSMGYKMDNGDLCNLPTLNKEERDFLINLARSYDETPAPVTRPPREIKQSDFGEKKTCWADYNEKADLVQFLEMQGWKECGRNSKNILLTRPNKDTGISGSVRIADQVFYCFTSSTQFEPNTAYSPFAVLCKLSYKGDFSACAKELYQKGYGDRVKQQNANLAPKNNEAKPLLNNTVEGDLLDKEILSVRFDFNEEIKETDCCLKVENEDGSMTKVASFSNVVAIVGKQKSRKSTLLGAIVSSALSGQTMIGFNLQMQGRKVLYFDTELPKPRFQVNQKKILQWAGQYKNDYSKFESFAFREFDREKRLRAIERMIYKYKDVGLIVIDGLKDLVKNYNEVEESTQIVERIMQWASLNNTLVLIVLHLNKTSDTLRGHLGTEIQNKCDAIVECKRSDDNTYTQVICRESRELGFAPFIFYQQEDGTPVLDLDYQLPTETKQNNSATWRNVSNF